MARRVTGRQEKSISTTSIGPITARFIASKRLPLLRRVQKALQRKTVKRRVVRYGLLAANAVILLGVVAFVATTSHQESPLASNLAVAEDDDVANPIDRLTSYDIAANIATVTSLPERNAVTNQAQSAKVSLALSSSDANVIAKPQIVATALKSWQDIRNYTVATGDTITSIAQKFAVTSDSIRWSNNLTGDAVSPGKVITIPPVNGIVYTVAGGDTVQSLATKYKANADLIAQYNDAETTGLVVGRRVIIPDGQLQVIVAPRPSYSVAGGASSFTAIYGNNGYDYGWCTWYVASQIAVPNNWGNASTWAYYAAQSGWTVSSSPRVGAIAQTTSGNHVAIVNQVSEDGSRIIYSDMNGISGWGRVGTSGWVSASHFEHYIYR